MDWEKKIYPKDIVNLFKREKIKRPVGFEMIHIKIIKALCAPFIALYEAIVSEIKFKRDARRALNNARSFRKSDVFRADEDFVWNPHDDYWDVKRDYSHLSQRRADRIIIRELEKQGDFDKLYDYCRRISNES